jgi:hypothetical protein
MRRLTKTAGWWLMLAALAAGVLAFGAAACDDDSGDGGEGTAAPTSADPEADVEAAVRSFIDSWNAGNVADLLALFTDQGVEQTFQATRAEAEAALGEFIGSPQATLGEIVNTVVTADDTATAEVTFFFGKGGAPQQVSLVLQGADWKIDGLQYITGEVPSGATAVDISLQEFAFVYEKSGITGGNVAFNVTNTGQQPHEMILFTIPADADVQEILQSEEEEIPGVEEVAAVGPFAPGTETTAVFDGELASGRYLLACFLPDADDPEMTPHAFKGMVTDFTVP